MASQNSHAKISELAVQLLTCIEAEKTYLREREEKMRDEMNAERQAYVNDFEQRFQQLQIEQANLNAEKEAMQKIAVRENDVITINVGGTIYSVKRSTLTSVFPNSYLATMFSGRWETQIERDQNGNFFLDYDPSSFGIILSYLRDKRMESPQNPAPVPVVPADKKDHFDNLLRFLALQDQFPVRYAEGMIPNQGMQPYQMQNSQQGGSYSSSSMYGGTTPLNSQQMMNQQAMSFLPGSQQDVGGQHQQSQLSTLNNMNMVKMHQQVQMDKEKASAQGASAAGQGQQKPKSTPGWSRRYCHSSVQVEEGGRCTILDTNAGGTAGAVRATRGFNKGVHGWQIKIGECSDYSYVGFVDDTWNSFSSSVGKSIGSWGIASNGIAHAQKHATGNEVAVEYGQGSLIEFFVDMDNRVCSVCIDGKKIDNVFTDLPGVIYPAVSNCRKLARYQILFN